mmetsp:Transcript_8287/g.12032  ORF Transcript_8287/g.12032 Transcript_8287/m.12032 type:complete len:141 (-) Transcript_8287:121-543(-)
MSMVLKSLLALAVAPLLSSASLIKSAHSMSGKACPSSSLELGMTKDAAGTPVFSEKGLTPGTCESLAMTCPEDGVFKLCGPGTWTFSRMTCDKHDYKAVSIEHPSDSYSKSDCKVYELKDYYQIDTYIGSVTFTCDTASR